VLLANDNETEWRPGPWRAPDDMAPDLYAAARLVARALPPIRSGGEEAA
jgi:hypothetical protein